MTKYNKLKKKIFEHKWYMDNDLISINKIVFDIAKLETENKYKDTKVLKNSFCHKDINNSWVIGQVVEITNKIGKSKYKTQYLQVITLTYNFNSMWYNFITLY